MLILNAGCGKRGNRAVRPKRFRSADWTEIRLDLSPTVEPDVVANMLQMGIATDSVDAIWSSHVIEHVYHHQVIKALRECHRVLKIGGELCLRTPDLQAASAYVAAGKTGVKLWDSPRGPVYPLDVIYGHRMSVAQGSEPMAHKTGLNAETLMTLLYQAGFGCIRVARALSQLELQASAYKLPEGASRTVGRIFDLGELPIPLDQGSDSVEAADDPHNSRAKERLPR